MKATWAPLLVAALAVYPRAGAAEPAPRRATSAAPVLQLRLVGAAHTPELRELLLEWFASENQRVSISFRRSVSPDQLEGASDGPPLRAWLVLRGTHRARIVFADSESRRYFVRDVPLDNALDELGREKVAQILLTSFQAFTDRRVEDTPVEQAQQALSEPVDTAPSPAAAGATSSGTAASSGPGAGADGATATATAATKTPAGAGSAASASPEPGETTTAIGVPTTDSSAPGASTARSGPAVPGSLSAAIAAGYSVIYRGPAGVAQGPAATLEGWFDGGGWGLGLIVGGRYEFEHTEPGEHVDLRVHTTALRVGLVLATVDARRPTWHFGFGFGWDWLSFEPEQIDPNVELRSSEQTERPLVTATLGRFVSLGSVRLGAAVGAELALKTLHYDVLVEGQPVRTLTPWQLAPQAQLSLAWH